MSKKSSAAAVSSWGFSGYIIVLPKKDKPSDEKPEKETATDKPKVQSEPKQR